MSTPRIEIDLEKIRQNTRVLVRRLGRQGIRVTGVTKGVCGHPEVARAMLDGGVERLGDARISNIERIRSARIAAPVTLIRTPMISEIDRVVRSSGVSLNVDLGVIHMLGHAARRLGRVHGIILMVELGDGREGLLPGELGAFARHVLNIGGIALKGIGANFACLSGCAPADPSAMTELSKLAIAVEDACGITLGTVSGGNSSSLDWASAPRLPVRINDLRLGEAILLGRDPLSQAPIAGLSTDAFTFVAEVIESTARTGAISQSATTGTSSEAPRNWQSVLATGTQDTDIAGLSPVEEMIIVGSTSDHLVVLASGGTRTVGSEVIFRPNYSALTRAMGAPDVKKFLHNRAPSERHRRLFSHQVNGRLWH